MSQIKHQQQAAAEEEEEDAEEDDLNLFAFYSIPETQTVDSKKDRSHESLRLAKFYISCHIDPNLLGTDPVKPF